jgi:hypothetical protein
MQKALIPLRLMKVLMQKEKQPWLQEYTHMLRVGVLKRNRVLLMQKDILLK